MRLVFEHALEQTQYIDGLLGTEKPKLWRLPHANLDTTFEVVFDTAPHMAVWLRLTVKIKEAILLLPTRSIFVGKRAELVDLLSYNPVARGEFPREQCVHAEDLQKRHSETPNVPWKQMATFRVKHSFRWPPRVWCMAISNESNL